ncbi:hypothetical protein HS1genome_1000 [Sulfodiicoccus acidiphilus]|uniref:Uncharacterized protein n=1 Tax=Sulfodiicoccus acidiphilus TaxID=1670455 RepID=A0A348B359_9CREN|nr:hypothetical protein [Sulfodiicoccus acidiphilus]BBD72611.1 hypothetical protein HS1genome_1000 [Sulfodiicoccus acidiphilus]GGT93343.1 hypothetical protein GCM10007116_08760 [Sulfodiicoccus acidiphilus]
MTLEFHDFLEVKLLRASYARLSEELSARELVRVRSAVRKLLNVIERAKLVLKSSRLRNLIEKLERVGKELLTVIRFRYFLNVFFRSLYNKLVERLSSLIALASIII